MIQILIFFPDEWKLIFNSSDRIYQLKYFRKAKSLLKLKKLLSVGISVVEMK